MASRTHPPHPVPTACVEYPCGGLGVHRASSSDVLVDRWHQRCVVQTALLPSRTGRPRSRADPRPAGWAMASSSALARLVTCSQSADPWARPPSGVPSPPAGPGETRPVVCALAVGGCHAVGADGTGSCHSSAPWTPAASPSPGPCGAMDGHCLPCLLVRFVLFFVNLEKEAG